MEMTTVGAAPGLLHLRRPSASTAAAAVRAGAAAPFSYAPVGGTAGALPRGFDHDVHRAVIGAGPDAWTRAVAALRAWRQFDQPWICFFAPQTPIEVGQVVAFTSWQLGLWSLNVCRIVYVVDEPDRFGFAYGTLPGHAVAGEERFEVTRDPATGEVSFEIRKFSRLEHWAVRAVAPVARRLQIRFSVDALEAMRRAVAGS